MSVGATQASILKCVCAFVFASVHRVHPAKMHPGVYECVCMCEWWGTPYGIPLPGPPPSKRISIPTYLRDTPTCAHTKHIHRVSSPNNTRSTHACFTYTHTHTRRSARPVSGRLQSRAEEPRKCNEEPCLANECARRACAPRGSRQNTHETRRANTRSSPYKLSYLHLENLIAHRAAGAGHDTLMSLTETSDTSPRSHKLSYIHLKKFKFA